jgi:hypothetical protein
VNQLLDDAALLFESRRGKSAAFHGIEDAQEVLAFAKDNLGSPHSFSLCCVSYQV